MRRGDAARAGRCRPAAGRERLEQHQPERVDVRARLGLARGLLRREVGAAPPAPAAPSPPSAGHRPRPFTFTSPSKATTRRPGVSRPCTSATAALVLAAVQVLEAGGRPARDHQRVVDGEREALLARSGRASRARAALDELGRHVEGLPTRPTPSTRTRPGLWSLRREPRLVDQPLRGLGVRRHGGREAQHADEAVEAGGPEPRGPVLVSRAGSLSVCSRRTSLPNFSRRAMRSRLEGVRTIAQERRGRPRAAPRASGHAQALFAAVLAPDAHAVLAHVQHRHAGRPTRRAGEHDLAVQREGGEQPSLRAAPGRRACGRSDAARARRRRRARARTAGAAPARLARRSGRRPGSPRDRPARAASRPPGAGARPGARRRPRPRPGTSAAAPSRAPPRPAPARASSSRARASRARPQADGLRLEPGPPGPGVSCTRSSRTPDAGSASRPAARSRSACDPAALRRPRAAIAPRRSGWAAISTSSTASPASPRAATAAARAPRRRPPRRRAPVAAGARRSSRATSARSRSRSSRWCANARAPRRARAAPAASARRGQERRRQQHEPDEPSAHGAADQRARTRLRTSAARASGPGSTSRIRGARSSRSSSRSQAAASRATTSSSSAAAALVVDREALEAHVRRQQRGHVGHDARGRRVRGAQRLGRPPPARASSAPGAPERLHLARRLRRAGAAAARASARAPSAW